jgi:hypothetical protein
MELQRKEIEAASPVIEATMKQDCTDKEFLDAAGLAVSEQ